MPENVIHRDLHYPKAGIDISRPAQKQPWRQGPPGVDGAPTRIYTSAEIINCRGYDPATLRFRGGSRTGIKHYIPLPVVAGWIVQHLNTVVGVEAGVAVQTSLLGRVVTGIAVSQGNVYWFEPGQTTAPTAATNSSATTPALNVTGVMQSAPNNQKLYIVDGVHYRIFTPITNVVTTWTATSGTLPVDGSGNTARLITTWRGRTVLSGLIEDSQNWFMSAVSDPLNYNYSPASQTPTQAVAGNNSRLGFIGDIITGLIAYNDDLMLFGGNTSLYMMRGDPMLGGEIVPITTAIGVAFGQAFTQDPRGNVYFMSNTGAIYVMAPRGKPERLSTPIDKLLQDINTGTHAVRLEWNERGKGCHVFVTPLTAATLNTTHFFWENTNSWAKDRFANKNHNPLASCTIDGNTPDDRVVLIGSWDGFINAFSPDATTDCGTAIESEVWIGPILTKNFDEVKLYSIQAILGESSGTIQYEIHYGRTAEVALNSSAVSRGTGTLSLSRNLSKLTKIGGHALYIRLTSTDRWAMEAIRVATSPNMSKILRRGA